MCTLVQQNRVEFDMDLCFVTCILNEYIEFYFTLDDCMTIVIAISKAPPFENWTIWNPTFKSRDFKCFQISNGQISDPTVFGWFWFN